MTNADVAVFDGKLSDFIKILKTFESKDNINAYTQDIQEIVEDLYRLQDRIREDWQ